MEQGSTATKRRWGRTAVIIAVTAAFVAPTAVWAADKFTDVPDSNVFHDDITWLADAAVTLGCNPPDNTQFCPSDNVTREQMAAFMRRLAENQIVDAGTLEGLAGEAYESPITATDPSAGDIALTSGTNQTIQELSVSVPSDGYLLITAGASYFDTDLARVLTWVQVDNTTCSNTAVSQETAFGYAYTGGNWDTISLSGSEAVTAGDHTVTLCGREFVGGFNPTYRGAAIQTIFSTTGSVG